MLSMPTTWGNNCNGWLSSIPTLTKQGKRIVNYLCFRLLLLLQGVRITPSLPRVPLRLPWAGYTLGFQLAFPFGPNNDKQSSLIFRNSHKSLPNRIRTPCNTYATALWLANEALMADLFLVPQPGHSLPRPWAKSAQTTGQIWGTPHELDKWQIGDRSDRCFAIYHLSITLYILLTINGIM